MDERQSTAGKRRSAPSLQSILIEDLRHSQVRSDLPHAIRELYRFYLDDEDRERLAQMGRIRRVGSMTWRLLRSLMLKLSPARRLSLFAAMIMAARGPIQFVLIGVSVNTNLRIWGFLILLVVLMLELRDKLVARDEIDVARKVQLALLPRTHPQMPGWTGWIYTRPANDVGGDLVDHLDLGGGHAGLVLGDVAGKGMGAALLMAKLQATLRALAGDGLALDELGARMSDILHRDGLENRYATLFCVALEAGSGRIRYLNAGHNPAYLLQGASHRLLEASAAPLGMFAGTRYREESLVLQAGEMIVIYSDGLTEAENAAGREFGVERLEALLPELARLDVEAAGRRILAAVDHYLGDRRPHDDLSLVLIRRTPDSVGT